LISAIIKSEKILYKMLEFLCHQSTLQPSLNDSASLLCNKGLYAVSNKPNDIKIGLSLYKLWQIRRWLSN